mmetsp:Transcript_50326/g.150364  ORF Transcript_50326/g.150364 Transcript_50326/m.150364 type:complete len:256 (-) Transcript_50326:466-1233(-)
MQGPPKRSEAVDQTAPDGRSVAVGRVGHRAHTREVRRVLLPRLRLQPLEVEVGASPHAWERLQVQRATQVARVEPAQRQAHAIACQGRALLREGGAALVLRGRGVHVGPDAVCHAEGDAARHVMHADRHLAGVGADGDDNGPLLDPTRVPSANLHGGAGAVLQQLDHDVEEILRHVREADPPAAGSGLGTLHLDLHVLLQKKVLAAELLGVARGLQADGRRVAAVVHDAVATASRVCGRLHASDVLGRQHLGAYP